VWLEGHLRPETLNLEAWIHAQGLYKQQTDKAKLKFTHFVSLCSCVDLHRLHFRDTQIQLFFNDQKRSVLFKRNTMRIELHALLHRFADKTSCHFAATPGCSSVAQRTLIRFFFPKADFKNKLVGKTL